MNNDFLHIEQIENFIRGNLDAKGRRQFEQQLAEDKDLQKEVQAYEVLLEGFKEIQLADFTQEVQQWENELRQQDKPTIKKTAPIKKEAPIVRMRFRRLAIAAGFLLLVLAGGYWWMGTQYSDTGLVASNYNPLESSTLRNSGGDAHPLEDGIKFYEQGNFASAVDYFGGISTTQESYPLAQLYLGHSYMQTRNYPKAIETFQALASTGDIRYAEEAEWHHILALVGNHQSGNSFTEALNAILADADHDYYADAQKLQNQLNSFWRKLAR